MITVDTFRGSCGFDLHIFYFSLILPDGLFDADVGRFRLIVFRSHFFYYDGLGVGVNWFGFADFYVGVQVGFALFYGQMIEMLFCIELEVAWGF